MDEPKIGVTPETPEGEPSTPENGEPVGGEPTAQTVPLERFREVYGKVKELEGEISTLKAKPQSAEDDKELQAKLYLKNLYKRF